MTLTAEDRALAASIAAAHPMEGSDLEKYIAALRSHDWSFEFADDYTVYQRGHNSLSRLQLMQRRLDPEFVVWNQHAPESHKRAAQTWGVF